MKKADIALAISIILVAFCIFGFWHFTAQKGQVVSIEIDGKVYGVYPLNKDKVVEVSTSFGKNTVKIESESVSITYADCPDGYCVSHISISKEGETIVCLPHRMMVEIKGDKNG